MTSYPMQVWWVQAGCGWSRYIQLSARTEKRCHALPGQKHLASSYAIQPPAGLPDGGTVGHGLNVPRPREITLAS